MRYMLPPMPMMLAVRLWQVVLATATEAGGRQLGATCTLTSSTNQYHEVLLTLWRRAMRAPAGAPANVWSLRSHVLMLALEGQWLTG